MHTEKAVQLELPEIVENAFESKTDLDEFHLPAIPEECEKGNEGAGSEQAEKQKKRRIRKKSTVVKEFNLKPIIPKITPIPEEVKEGD